jgi:hypothetical protein
MNGREKLRERSPVGEAATREDGRVRWGARLCLGGRRSREWEEESSRTDQSTDDGAAEENMG